MYFTIVALEVQHLLNLCLVTILLIIGGLNYLREIAPNQLKIFSSFSHKPIASLGEVVGSTPLGV